MKAVKQVQGNAFPLNRADVDTDQIIPKQFLKRIERTGYGEFAFFDWRKDDDFIINQPDYQGAPIMLAQQNFGCGSSREHAVWALDDMGIEAVIAPSFGDIFRNNSSKVGLLTIQLPHAQLADTGLERQWRLFDDLRARGQAPVILDSRELLLDPRGVLRALCRHLDLEFDPCMLRWEAGARPEDGIWARHWYHAVHKSTGWAPFVAKANFPAHLEGLLAECRPWYERLFAHALRARPAGERT